MAKIVFDASSIVGALLKQGSVPERALLLARSKDTVCLSVAVEAEIRDVLSRPKFERYLPESRVLRILELITAAAIQVEIINSVTDCRDTKDNKYLELALAADAEFIIASDNDLLALDPWRGIRIITPLEYVSRFESEGSS
jgi:putative PIN family toxin of toxin-antitoxin system